METAGTSSVAGEFGSGLLGAGIALGCLLPPLLHLVTGPLGPLIGGFVAGNRAKPSGRGIAIIAVTVGTVIAAIVGVGGTIVSNLSRSGGGSELPDWLAHLLSGPTLFAIVGVVWAYAAGLSAGGAFLSGVLSRHKSSEAS